MVFGLNHACRGLFRMLRKERNFKIQVFVFVLVIVIGFILRISIRDWFFVLMISALVLSFEAINSAIEKTCDLFSTERNEKIKNIKDISAGAVLIAALFASISGILIFLPYIKEVFLNH